MAEPSLLGRSRDSGRTRARRARIPPSPRLSACRTTARYLTLITRISDQKIMERMPKMCLGSGSIPCSGLKHSRTAYSGLVPMSP
jgi:hypothetical protein